MIAWFLFVLLFNPPVLDAAASQETRMPSCRNPKGKLWSSVLDKDCGQSVCKKRGRKGVWEQCPRPVTEDNLQEMKRTIITKLEEKIEEQCGVEPPCPDINQNYDARLDPEWVDDVQSWEGCSQICLKRPDCKYWTWHHGDSGDWAYKCVTMKDGHKKKPEDTNTISGTRQCVGIGPGPWCIKDNPSRVFVTYLGASQDNTVDNCIDRCLNYEKDIDENTTNGFKFAGLVYSQCFCGQYVPPDLLLPLDECVWGCPEAEVDDGRCGAPWRLSVYPTGLPPSPVSNRNGYQIPTNTTEN